MEAKREQRPHVGSPYMDDEIPEAIEASLIASVNLKGDVSGMTARDRESHYLALCKALGLNPLTQPLAWVRLNGKEVLYVGRGATDQLAARHGLNRRTIRGPEIVDLAGAKVALCVVEATLPNGRSETATATLPVSDPANLYMKLETKAKRRATLSILGLGLLDETELETIPGAERIERPDPRRVETIPAPAEEPTEDAVEEGSRAVVTFEHALDDARLCDVGGFWQQALSDLRGEGKAPEEWTRTLGDTLDAWLTTRGYRTLSAADKTALVAGHLPPDLMAWHDDLAHLLPLSSDDRRLSDDEAARLAAETWLASRWSSTDQDTAKPARLALQRWMAAARGQAEDTKGAGTLLAATVQRLRAERAAAVDALTAAPSEPTRAREPGDDDDLPPQGPPPRKGRRKATDATSATAEDTSWQTSREDMERHACGLRDVHAVRGSAIKHKTLVGYAAVLAARLQALDPGDEHGTRESYESALRRVNGWMAQAQAAQRRAA